MVTLRDIAEKAGVSRMTVSLALRSAPQVSKKTQRLILKIADKLGYQRNPKVTRAMAELAKSRHVEATESLAFLTSDRTETGWREWQHNVECFEGAQDRAREYGYTLEPFWLRQSKMTPEKISRMLWARGIDGVMIAPLGHDFQSNGKNTFEFDWNRFSVVELAETLDTPRFDCARHDHYEGMLQVLFSLERKGYRRIGLAMELILDVRTRHRWYSAYLLWKSVRGFSLELPVLFFEKFDIEQTTVWLEKNRLDAVVSSRNQLCVELQEIGLRIPDDLGVVGLDIPSGDGGFRLSGISQRAVSIGSSAADLLVGLVHRGQKGIPQFPNQKICAGFWVDGVTTRCVGEPLENRSLFDHPLSNG